MTIEPPRAIALPKRRADYLPRESLFMLHKAAEQVLEAYDSYGVYLVGSVMETPNYRDVDVRCIMADDVFEAEFPRDDQTHRRLKWEIVCMAMSAWFKATTGLPVDFQFQKAGIANEKYNGPRSALGHFSYGGDAI
jgi:hypothetical protein